VIGNSFRLNRASAQERYNFRLRRDNTPARSGYYHYFSFGWGSYIADLLVRIREEVLQIFIDLLRPSPAQTILDIGVSADDHHSSNHLEKRYAHTERICGLSIDHHPELRSQFSLMALVEGDARALPFASESFDFVYSHAVIEHVGSRAEQLRFLAEALRVARCGAFITTPNRWFPVETHTGLPLLHFLPARFHRWAFRTLGKSMYGTQQQLNLMGARTLRGLARQVQPSGAIVRLRRVWWLGFPSNLVIAVLKAPHQSLPSAGPRR
jgi:hypothetical protein